MEYNCGILCSAAFNVEIVL